MEFIEKGTLPIGFEYGETLRTVHPFFSLKPLRVAESMALRNSPDYERAKDNPELLGLLSLAHRLTIEEVPASALTLDAMLSMYEDDLVEILAADGRLREQIARFRGEVAPAVDAAAGQDRDAVGVGPDYWPEGSTGVDRGLAGYQ